MLRPFSPLVYAADAVERFGEPTRHSSDRSPRDGNPISVRLLHAAESPGSYRRGEQRSRTFVARGVMVEHEPGYVRYRIDRPGRPALVGLVGVLDVATATLHAHEGVMPSAVAARRADIERAGAHLEPIVVASIDPIDVNEDGGTDLRTVRYGEELHKITAVKPSATHAAIASRDPGFVVLDGHHRIAAALQHSELTGEPPWILTMVVDVATAGLFVEPQHRVLGGPPIDLETLSAVADTTPYERGERVPPGAVAVVSGTTSIVAVTKSSSRSGALARISSLTLHEDILPVLDLWVEGYATREADAYDELDAGARAVAIMGDLEIADVVDTARTGVVLPEKTTCFNPKVAVGLVGVKLPFSGSR
jgi:hypothetical protein